MDDSKMKHARQPDARTTPIVRTATLTGATLLPLVLWLAPGCSSSPLPSEVGGFAVSFAPGTKVGSPSAPLAFTTDDLTFTLNIQALKNTSSGEIDPTWDGYVLIAARPVGTVAHSPLAARVTGGAANEVKVVLRNGFGTVRLIVTDVGYVPAADPSQAICNNELDDDGDGFVDKTHDQQTGDLGCTAGDDDTEEGGTNATGSSPPIYFATPTIADVQRPILGKTGDQSPLNGVRVSIQSGFMLVTRLSTDGMYLTDFDGVTWSGSKFLLDHPLDLSYHSVFAYNFSTPINIEEGDCLVQLDGTVSEFFGYTELGMPTWKKGDYTYCSALARTTGVKTAQCPVDDVGSNATAASSCLDSLDALATTPVDLTTLTVPAGSSTRSIWDQNYMETERFEAALVELKNVTMFSEMRTCDTNGNGIIDYSITAEKNCANDCGDSVSCVVAESYATYKQWTVHFKDGLGSDVEVNVVTTGGIPGFDPTKAKGKTLKSIVGTLRHLTFGKPPWILEPRRDTDCPECTN
jgi:hypothetical protein